jgi:drug/metabolite transporter (DMT)-like permease
VFATVGILGYRRKQASRAAGAPAVLDRRALLSAMGVGVLGYYVASLLDFSALTYISAQLDRLILMTYPFFVVLFAAAFLGRRITLEMAAALVVSWVGIAVIFWRDFSIEGDNVLLGSVLVFGSALAYAGYQLLAKPVIDRMGAGLFTSIAMSAAGVVVTVHFVLTHPLADLAVSGHAFWLMVAIGTVSTVLPADCLSGAIGLIGPERTAVVGNISPIVTVGLAVLVLGEAFTVWHAAGTAMVLGGVWAFTWVQKARSKARSP